MKKYLPALIMKRTLFCFIALFLSLSVTRAQLISTVAGSGTQGFSGDGGPATAADLSDPNAVGFDNAGNMYIADEGTNHVRKVDLSGIITTFAGNGTAGFSGDGGPATAAEFDIVEGVCADKSGNVFFPDMGNERIRKVNSAGIISTFAGNGSFGFSGDGGQATAAELDMPYRVVVDTIGNIYIDDYGNYRIRKINTLGIITTVAGNGTGGFSGDGGQATAAELDAAYGLCVDLTGNIYIADESNRRVRKVNTNGIITTIAGNGVMGFQGDGGPATAAELSSPFGVAADAYGNVFIDDQGNVRVRLVDPTGKITTYAGDGASGYNGDGIPATSASLFDPWDVTVDPAGNLYISDETNERVRKVPGVPLSVLPPINTIGVGLYPNPNHGVFTMEVNGIEFKENTIIKIYNLLGKEIYSSQLTSGNHILSIDLSSQSTGLYLYRVINTTGTIAVTGKFVID